MRKRLIGLGMCLVLLLTFVPFQEVKADMGGWTTDARGVMTITGTTVTVRIDGSTAIVEGIGEIPDYDPTTYTKRPWHYYDIKKVVIGQGITRIGSFAFADKANLKTIELCSTTFIADGTSFSNIAPYPVIRLKGQNSAVKMIGTIPYQSLESIISNAPSGRGCAYIADNNGVVNTIQGMTYPYLPYVYSASDTNAPWNTRVDTTKDITFKKLGMVLSGDAGNMLQVQKKPQGELYMNVIANFLKDYTYACSYSVTLTTSSGEVLYGTNGNRIYSIKLDARDQIWSRQYTLIEIGPDGQVLYLPDLDADFSTVTFETYYPTSVYALVYKY